MINEMYDYNLLYMNYNCQLIQNKLDTDYLNSYLMIVLLLYDYIFGIIYLISILLSSHDLSLKGTLKGSKSNSLGL